MDIINKLKSRWKNIKYPFFIHPKGELLFSDFFKQNSTDLSIVKKGDVVALIGDFNTKSIMTLLQLIQKKTILVPLILATRSQHDYFFKTALVDIVIEGSAVRRIKHNRTHEFINILRNKNHAGLIAFTSGTTSGPKAVFHDLTLFMQRFETPRPTFKTLNFLMFDHIGGLNTLLHTLFNKGTIVIPKSHSVEDILETCSKHSIEVLPATPTFLRMMLLSGFIPEKISPSLSIITYGSERMDQPTLDRLCELLPKIDFRQTYGTSELGVLRVKSKARNSLFMKVGGEGGETRGRDNILEIRSSTRMLGYLNAASPFDKDGWYRTNDIVNVNEGYYMITGRTSEIINVGGLKFIASEVERVALQFDGVELVKVVGKQNPISGQHAELTIKSVHKMEIDMSEFKKFLKKNLPRHMVPQKIRISTVSVGHRQKRN